MSHTTRTHTVAAPSMHVLVVGAGFAGAVAAVRLAGRAHGRARVTVVNPRPTFVNRLRLHQLAVGRDVPAPSIARMLGPDVTFVEGWVDALDPDAGRATISGSTGTRTLGFDRVVLATGSSTAPPVVPGGDHTHAVGSLEAAQRLRPALQALPAGADIAVVGAGFTGLETVGEVAEARPDARVRLVAAGEIGSWFNPRAAAHVRATLGRLGVELVGGAPVRSVEPDRLLLEDGGEVPSRVTIWCGGFASPALAREAGIAVDPSGAVVTDAALRSVSHPQVLAVGDAGHTEAADGDRYSMSCQFALPSGAHAADILRDDILGRSAAGPVALDLGFQARCLSLGSRAAVLQVTDHDDVATERALTGAAARAAKRFQVRGVVAAIGAERRMPGLIRWPGAGRTADRLAAQV